MVNSWKELVVNVETTDDNNPSFIKSFWWQVDLLLEEKKGINDVPQIDENPLFHFRWCGSDKLEVFRLNLDNWNDPIVQEINKLPALKMPEVKNVFWRNMEIKRTNRFWTFLQACSIIRVKHDITTSSNLQGPEMSEEAYTLMRSPDQPWSEKLRPWFDHLDQLIVDNPKMDDHLEYGHWFGHIVSKRFV